MRDWIVIDGKRRSLKRIKAFVKEMKELVNGYLFGKIVDAILELLKG